MDRRVRGGGLPDSSTVFRTARPIELVKGASCVERSHSTARNRGLTKASDSSQSVEQDRAPVSRPPRRPLSNRPPCWRRAESHPRASSRTPTWAEGAVTASRTRPWAHTTRPPRTASANGVTTPTGLNQRGHDTNGVTTWSATTAGHTQGMAATLKAQRVWQIVPGSHSGPQVKGCHLDLRARWIFDQRPLVEPPPTQKLAHCWRSP
jgi:hypothetical protein